MESRFSVKWGGVKVHKTRKIKKNRLHRSPNKNENRLTEYWNVWRTTQSPRWGSSDKIFVVPERQSSWSPTLLLDSSHLFLPQLENKSILTLFHFVAWSQYGLLLSNAIFPPPNTMGIQTAAVKAEYHPALFCSCNPKGFWWQIKTTSIHRHLSMSPFHSKSSRHSSYDGLLACNTRLTSVELHTLRRPLQIQIDFKHWSSVKRTLSAVLPDSAIQVDVEMKIT